MQRGIDPVASVQLGATRVLASDRIEERLQKLGYGLWKMLIPKDLKEYYAAHRDEWRDKTFVIMSDEPSIPWELVWPYDDVASNWEDSNPWCLTFRLSRWLRRDEQGNGSAGPPSSLLLTQLATLIPSDTGLPAVRAESEYLRAFVQRHGVRDGGIVPATKENAEKALSTGCYDWLHVAAHGAARDVAQETTPVWLENGEPLTPDDIVGPRIERHIRTQRPAFVLNACTAARSGWELTGISGWANQLIKVGAGLFLAPLWSVTDGVAKEFVTAFYDALEKNACVADAMRAARMTARRTKGDPTWMAYVLFAHPNARVALGTAAGSLSSRQP